MVGTRKKMVKMIAAGASRTSTDRCPAAPAPSWFRLAQPVPGCHLGCAQCARHSEAFWSARVPAEPAVLRVRLRPAAGGNFEVRQQPRVG